MEIGTVTATLPLYVLGLVAVVSCVFGTVKSFTKVKHNGLVWAAASGIFLILVKLLIENRALASLPVFRSWQPNVVNFIVAIVVIALSVFLSVGTFATVRLALSASRNRRLARVAEKVAEEDGENVVGEPPLTVVDDSPHPISRIFGGVAATFNALSVAIALFVLVLLVLHATPLKEGALADFYTQGATGAAWSFLHKYALDLFVIAYVAVMVRKGFEIGFLEVLRRTIVFVGACIVLVGPFLWLFSPRSAEGTFAFWGNFGEAIGAWLFGATDGTMPLTVGVIIGKIAIGCLLAAVGCVLVVSVNWLMKRFVCFVGDVKALSVAERILATAIFFVFALSVVFVLSAIFYAFHYYGVFDIHVFFAPSSPLNSAFFGACEQWLNPIFEQVARLLGS